MPVNRTPHDKALVASSRLRCYHNAKWRVNGDPSRDDLTTARLVATCLRALAPAGGEAWRSLARGERFSRTGSS